VIGSAGPGWSRAAAAIPRSNRRWLIVNALGVSALINVVINFAIAWLGTRSVHSVAAWAVPLRRPSTIIDTLATSFTLPFVTTITATPAVVRELRAGRLLPLRDSDLRRTLERLPRPVVRRAFRVALWTGLTVGPAATLTLAATTGSLSVSSFLIFKVAFAVALGLVVTPLVALAAMSHEEVSATL
jgi:hypothetical protein